MQEVKFCMECNIQKKIPCFHASIVCDKKLISIRYSSVCAECKIKKMMETISDRYEYDRQFIRKLRETPEYRQHEDHESWNNYLN